MVVCLYTCIANDMAIDLRETSFCGRESNQKFSPSKVLLYAVYDPLMTLL